MDQDQCITFNVSTAGVEDTDLAEQTERLLHALQTVTVVRLRQAGGKQRGCEVLSTLCRPCAGDDSGQVPGAAERVRAAVAGAHAGGGACEGRAAPGRGHEQSAPGPVHLRAPAAVRQLLRAAAHHGAARAAAHAAGAAPRRVLAGRKSTPRSALSFRLRCRHSSLVHINEADCFACLFTQQLAMQAAESWQTCALCTAQFCL